MPLFFKASPTALQFGDRKCINRSGGFMARLLAEHLHETSKRRLDVLRWGLIPQLIKDFNACKRPINARSAKAATAGMFRGAPATRRCQMPADAFYEWKTMADGEQPYSIARWDAAPIALLGLWEGWRDPASEAPRTFAFLTTAANDDVGRLHDRIPVILEDAGWPVWLGEEADDHLTLLRQSERGVVRLSPVSRAVNSVRNNRVDLLNCIDDLAALLPNDAPAGDDPQ